MYSSEVRIVLSVGLEETKPRYRSSEQPVHNVCFASHSIKHSSNVSTGEQCGPYASPFVPLELPSTGLLIFFRDESIYASARETLNHALRALLSLLVHNAVPGTRDNFYGAVIARQKLSQEFTWFI